jgi:hypothetical protein
MSRLRNYAAALGSSYVALAANIVYTLASVPLALSYLDKASFALWGLSIQIAGYVALIDLGMAASSRILIDYKDQKDGGAYGGIIQTSILVGIVQAVLVAVAGVVAAFALVPVLDVPPSLEKSFRLIVAGQCAFMAAGFLTRVFAYLLVAHQRQDVINYLQIATFAGSFAILWLFFEAGSGVLSLLAAQAFGWILTAAVTIYWCWRVQLFPSRGKWGRPSWSRFSELFAFGRDIFVFVLGSQLINASQIILVTRQLGLDAAAVWVICTRSFTLAGQLVSRIFESSCPALAEMIVRQERSWLLHRFRSIVLLSSSAAVVIGMVCATANQTFVQIWTGGKAGWAVANDVLLAVLMVITASARCHVGLVGQAKDFRFLRYLYLVEGVWFILLSLLFLKSYGISAMILAAISGTLLFSFPYGTWRTARCFQISWREAIWNWSLPTLRLGLVLVVVGTILWWLTNPLSDWLAFGIRVTAGLICGGPLLFYLGIDSALRHELRSQARVLWRKSLSHAGASL